ncbi:phage distal tail protein [Lachnospiraceae bacterium LCP25S3_G4]
MSKNVILKFERSDKKIFVIDGTDYGITEIKGIDYPEIEKFTEKNAVGDGDFKTGERIASREIEFSAKLKDSRLNEIARKQVISFFNAKYGFKLYVTYQSNQKWIDAELIGFKCPSANVYKNIEIAGTFLCLNPYFQSMDNFGKNIAAITPMSGFPYMSIIGKGFNVGIYNFANIVDISNDGDVETFCKAVFTSKGQVVNPKLVKNGKYVRVLDTLVANDVVIMDFVNNNITKNGVKSTRLLDRSSQFTSMQLDVGDNKISFGADSGDSNLDVTIYYNQQYLGV